jgi:glutamate-1-semialdehyde 2,1-aminomutase
MTETTRAAEIERLLDTAGERFRRHFPRSAAHYEAAARVLPRGTTRSRFWWPQPLYVDRAEGSRVVDLDGHELVDCNLGFGPLILGHRHPRVLAALEGQMARGVHFGAASTGEEALARRICDSLPGCERVVFLNSGTEATLAALRIARAATGREKVAKFEGGWHGAQEFLFHNYATVAGDPSSPPTVPDMAGIPRAVSETVVVLPFNDARAIERVRREGHDLAAVIVEPVQGGGGSLPARPEFLHDLRRACEEVGAVFVLDEVITGYRLGPQSAAGRYGLRADLTTLGKVVGGGLPVGAVGGRADLIELAAPVPPAERGRRTGVVVAGTFAGNPMTTAAGAAQLDVLLERPELYDELDRLGDEMRSGLEKVLHDLGVEAHVTGTGSLWGLHFGPSRPESVRDRDTGGTPIALLLAARLAEERVLMSAPVHLGFLSTAHSDEDVSRALEAHRRALEGLREEGVL